MVLALYQQQLTTHRRVPSGTDKRKLNTIQNSHAYM